MIEMEDIPITKEEYIAMVKTINQLRKEKQHLINKAYEWLIDRYENQGVVLLEDINELKQVLEEQQ